MKTSLKYLFTIGLALFIAGCKKEKIEVDTTGLAGKYRGDIKISDGFPGVTSGETAIFDMEDMEFSDVELTLVSPSPNKIDITMPEDITAAMEEDGINFDFRKISSDVSFKKGVYTLSGNTEIVLPESTVIPGTDSQIKKINAVTSGTINASGNADIKIEFKIPYKIPGFGITFNYVITVRFTGNKIE